MSFQEAHMRQARGISRAFFAVLRSQGFCVTDQEEISIAGKAFNDHSFHVDSNKVFQNSIDDLKLLSFLTYRFLLRFKGGQVRKVTEACLKTVVLALNMRGIDLPKSLRRYIESLVYHEVMDKGEVGIGGNGLAAVFTVVSRIKKEA